MGDNNVLLEGISLFEYLMKRQDKLPHEIVNTMIEHKQDLSGVKVYLECIIDDINKASTNENIGT